MKILNLKHFEIIYWNEDDCLTSVVSVNFHIFRKCQIYSLTNETISSMSKSAWTCRFIYTVLVVTLSSGFHTGFHIGVVNTSRNTLTDWMKHTLKIDNEDKVMIIWSTTVACFSMGAIIGGALTASALRIAGPKTCLFWSNLLAIIGSLMMIFSKQARSYGVFIAGRLVVGINAGLNCGLFQIYLVEISPSSIRGVVCAFHFLFVVITILIAQLAGWAMSSEALWCFLFVIPLVVAIFQLFTLPFCPESPMYLLIEKDDEGKAEKALRWLRGTEDVTEELKVILEEDNLVKQLRKITLKRILSNRALKMSLIICSAVVVGQVSTGIAAIVYYADEFYNTAIVENKSIDEFSMILTGIRTIPAVSSLWLIYFCKRRKILFFGFLGLAFVTLAIILSLQGSDKGIDWCKYLAAVLFVVYVTVFTAGVGHIPWFCTAELFPYSARPLAVSVTVPIQWLAGVIYGQTFLLLVRAVGYHIYLVFVITDIFFFVCVYLYMPETSKMSTKDIVELYY